MQLSVVLRKEDILTARPGLQGATAIVIDVLRATSTMVTAMHSGAREIRLASTPEEARAIADSLPKQSRILAGERQAVQIPGFDLGNSPSDFSPERVGGKIVVFTTTNGTEALRGCAAAGAWTILIGSLLNVKAVTAVACADLKKGKDIVLVCSGTEGTVGLDDAYAAGAIVTEIERSCDAAGRPSLEDSAIVARRHFAAGPSPAEVLKLSRAFRNMERAGLVRDLQDCFGKDLNLAPRYYPADNAVRAK